MSLPIPTPHINAPKDGFAKTVLMPGDPKRAKYIADNYLKNAVLVNDVRGVQGYTGEYKGKKVSVMASGMGMPSIGIYSYELFHAYDVDHIIRVGTAGGLVKDLKLKDIIVGNGACTDSSLQSQRFGLMHYAPVADFELLNTAYNKSKELGLKTVVGLCASSDRFYDDNENWKLWKKYGVVGIEMEAAELYTLAAEFKRKALAILTVSDHIVKGTATTAEERQTTFKDMMKLALETIIA